MDRTIRVRAIIALENKLLAVQHTQHSTDPAASPENNWWALPGGKVEPGEALVPALERELFEELGVHAVVGKLLYVHQFAAYGGESLEFFFEITNSQDFTAINLATTSHGTIEIAKLGFIDPTKEHILPEFLKTESLSAVSDIKGPRFFSYV